MNLLNLSSEIGTKQKLISIARQGRSLGVHLILATQNISAAVDPEILQNSNFRICLKVAEPQDSIQMVGIPDAVNLTRGRGYFASNTRFLYQSAFSGAPYEPDEDQSNTLKPLSLPFGHRPLVSSSITAKDRSSFSGKTTQVSAVIEYINQQAENLGLKKPSSVWQNPLPERLYLPDVLKKAFSGGWDGETWQDVKEWESYDVRGGDLVLPVFGLLDQPSNNVRSRLGSTKGKVAI